MNLKAGDKIRISYYSRSGEKEDGSRKATKRLKVLAVYENFILTWNGRYRECINNYDILIRAVNVEKI